MAISIHQFYWEMYEEYIEEGSFLYEQRIGLYDDIELSWLDIEQFEERIEAHLDGLVVGRELAVKVAEEHADGSDAGELFMAISLFCRQNRKDLVDGVIDELDAGDEEVDKAVADALIFEAPFAWLKEWSNKPNIVQDAYWFNILILVIGFRRLGAGAFIAAELQDMNVAARDGTPLNTALCKNMVMALGRLQHREAADSVVVHMQSDDEALQAEAVLALLRMGDKRAVAHLLELMDDPKAPRWAMRLLAMSGGQTESEALLAKPLTANNIIALGWLGDSVAVSKLIAALKNSSFTEEAAEALQVITGANLEEDALIPEAIDEDLLTKKELTKHREALAAGEPSPLIDPNDPPGETIERLSQDHAQWEEWWDKHRKKFKAGARYREGRPFGPQALLEQLVADTKLPRLREYAFHEMAIRYDLNSAFELELPVAQQRQLLNDWLPEVKKAAKKFATGRWYFAGKLMDAE